MALIKNDFSHGKNASHSPEREKEIRQIYLCACVCVYVCLCVDVCRCVSISPSKTEEIESRGKIIRKTGCWARCARSFPFLGGGVIHTTHWTHPFYLKWGEEGKRMGKEGVRGVGGEVEGGKGKGRTFSSKVRDNFARSGWEKPWEKKSLVIKKYDYSSYSYFILRGRGKKDRREKKGKKERKYHNRFNSGVITCPHFAPEIEKKKEKKRKRQERKE